jgi:peroxiredoxin
MRSRALVVLVAALALALAGCLGGDGADAGDEPPEWSFTDTEGQEHTHEDARGTPTVVFFMATWCPSCQDQTDALGTAANHTPDGVDFYSLSWDPDEGDDDLRSWKRNHDQPWPHGTDPGLAIADAYGVESQSTVAVLDANNTLVRRWDYGKHPTADDIGSAIETAEAG